MRVFGRDYPLPGIEYGAVTDQTQTSGTLHATVDPGEGGPVSSCELEYGTDASYGSTMPCNPDPSSSNFTSPTEGSASLSGLTPEQPYHYRFVVGNTNVTRNGADQVFVPHWVIALKTQAALNLTPATATLTGSFSGNGEHTTYHFEWGKTESYGSTTAEQGAGAPSGPTTVQSGLAGLAPVTTYHYRVVATNPGGTSTATDESFTTPPLPPELSEWVTDVHSDSVTFHALINPGGGDTQYRVEYVDDAPFQETGFTDAAVVPEGEGNVAAGFTAKEVSTKVAPLTPGTTYHYRVVATNAYRVTVGEEEPLRPSPTGGR